MEDEKRLTNSLRHITWRGAIRSCNYSCSYCPLAKKPPNQEEIEQDREALQRFIAFLGQLQPTQPLSILLAPYGEALLHHHVRDALAQMSRLEQIALVSCQTNLSFPAESLLHSLSEASMAAHKIALWASFHPSMTSLDTFAEQLRKLATRLRLVVVAIAEPESLPVIQQLAGLLPPGVRLRINAMDGLARRYTPGELSAFIALDPLFTLETRHHRSDLRFCGGGRQSIFVQADGSFYPCNRSKLRPGNLYDDSLAEITLPCDGGCRGRCDCFLAYSNRLDLPELQRLGAYPQLRCE